ncbi:polynucleotidyl transferase, ribonuclease H-like superfamily protein [Tanacetum coccineum]
MTSRASYLDNNPFNQEILEDILSKEFKIPKFQFYDATTNPDEHLMHLKGNRGPAGARVVLRDEDTNLVYCIREGLGTVTKGVAEYQALSLGLCYALERGYTHIRVEGESKHVCMQSCTHVDGLN